MPEMSCSTHTMATLSDIPQTCLRCMPQVHDSHHVLTLPEVGGSQVNRRPRQPGQLRLERPVGMPELRKSGGGLAFCEWFGGQAMPHSCRGRA